MTGEAAGLKLMVAMMLMMLMMMMMMGYAGVLSVGTGTACGAVWVGTDAAVMTSSRRTLTDLYSVLLTPVLGCSSDHDVRILTTMSDCFNSPTARQTTVDAVVETLTAW